MQQLPLDNLTEFFSIIHDAGHGLGEDAYTLYHAYLVEYSYGDTPGGHRTDPEDLEQFSTVEDLTDVLHTMRGAAAVVVTNLDRLLDRPDLLDSIVATVRETKAIWESGDPEEFGRL
jgi:hypothetical protein